MLITLHQHCQESQQPHHHHLHANKPINLVAAAVASACSAAAGTAQSAGRVQRCQLLRPCSGTRKTRVGHRPWARGFKPAPTTRAYPQAAQLTHLSPSLVPSLIFFLQTTREARSCILRRPNPLHSGHLPQIPRNRSSFITLALSLTPPHHARSPSQPGIMNSSPAGMPCSHGR